MRLKVLYAGLAAESACTRVLRLYENLEVVYALFFVFSKCLYAQRTDGISSAPLRRATKRVVFARGNKSHALRVASFPLANDINVLARSPGTGFGSPRCLLSCLVLLLLLQPLQAPSP